jgi:peptidoglycan/LPS O-acetylase OafA/YrhL
VTDRRFVPALEGLRGWSVLAVLLFHGQVLGVTGGFLGVSVFFTLSGYLITTLALAQVRDTDTFDARGFLVRRARRLVPAATAGIVLGVVATLVIGDLEASQRMVQDAVSSLVQMSNWHFIVSGQEYAALFTAPSAFAHYWSLSIETQFYVAFALVIGVAVPRRAVRPTSVLAVGFGGWVIALTLQVSGVFTASEIYLGSLTRSGEIFAGVALAGALADPTWQRRLVGRAGGRARAAGVIGVVVVISGWFLVSDPAGRITQGGLALYAVASAAVVLAALGPDGVVVLLCSNRPMQLLGRVSYGLYVVHWPVFLLVDHLVDLDGLGLFAVQLAVSIGLTVLSWTMIETRVLRSRPAAPTGRSRRPWAPNAVVTSLAVGAMAIAAGAVVVEVRQGTDLSVADAERSLEDRVDENSGDASPVDGGPPRLVVLGDSTALRTAEGLGQVLLDRGLAFPMGGAVELGCGFARVEYSLRAGDLRTNPRRCNWTRPYHLIVEDADPHIVVVQFGPWEVEEQILVGEERARHLGDPDFDDFVRSELDDVTEVLSRQGARVVWLDLPDAGLAAYESTLDGITPEEFASRRARWNELLAELPLRHEGTVGVVEISEWLDARRDDTDVREDGMHLTPEGARRLADEFLADELAAMMERLEVTP